MTTSPKPEELTKLKADLHRLLDRLPELENNDLIQSSLEAIALLSQNPTERLDWKLISGSLQDFQKAIALFHPHASTRKVSIFGSARTLPTTPEYQQAIDFAQCISAKGFMVITGGGGGIMAAGNQGAGKEHSFGLNISLPFEQVANGYVNDKFMNFKYFFTRKLFFLKESDAIALFPGGFGTQDEFFECLTLCQTGKATPRPLVLIDKPGGDYWQQWDAYIQKHLLTRGLITEGDLNLYVITDKVERACQAIHDFYKVYHSSRWVKNLFVVRLNFDISDAHLDRLNQNFSDVLVQGRIQRSAALPQEKREPHILSLPRLVMYFNQRNYGRLQQLILEINQTCDDEILCHSEYHPESK
ncbi:LOG family protein [Tumidithrix elongata RA019]|uniref:LOG family protein n=1 Tax=Tumidithrix elongata BACA0141 TaxID=2716417 RepID=A0AAW9Q7Y5_9CYAN|nr:LOG family protein [Tumidithrix elongata RA019]